MASNAKFFVGQRVYHKLFDYRGVIYDVDPFYLGTEEWYEEVARSRPSKEQPWYHVLVHDADHTTYVAECNLEPDATDDPIEHPLIGQFFSDLDGEGYVPAGGVN